MNINELSQLEDSNDFEYIREILIRLKKWELEFSNYSAYENYLRKFMHYRLQMKPEYICDTYLNLSDNDIISIIVKNAIDKILYCFEDRYTSINQVDATDNCIAFSYIVKDICDKLGISSDIIKIWPGYDANARLFGMSGFHYATIIFIQEKKYLVDLTYKQFFKKSHSFLEEIGVVGLCAPLPGIFMLMDEERKELVMELLQKGFIELKDNNLKLYCDGFTMSFRNGLYYEEFNTDFSTNYSDQDYTNFLFNKNDNQINHEPIKCLGPLKL